MKRIFLAIGFLLYALPASASLTVVQHVMAGGGNSASTTVACPLNTVTAGNFLIFGAGSIDTTAVTITVTDSNGTPSASDTSISAIDENANVFHETSTASGTHTFTFTRTGTGKDFYCFAVEVSGAAASAPKDVAGAGAATNPSMTSPSVTTTNANDILIAFAVGDAGSTPAPTAGTGYTLLDSTSNGGADAGSEYQIVSVTGNYSASYTFPGTGVNGPSVIVAYKASGGGGPSTMPPVVY